VVCQLLNLNSETKHVSLFQDLDKKLDTLVLHSSDMSEETEECKRYAVQHCDVDLSYPKPFVSLSSIVHI